ncbi:hypothetical protein AGIG_G23368 [Arapaima gigas]
MGKLEKLFSFFVQLRGSEKGLRAASRGPMGAVDKLCFWVLILVVQPGVLGVGVTLQVDELKLSLEVEAEAGSVGLFLLLSGILLVLLAVALVTVICVRRRRERPVTGGCGEEGGPQGPSKDSNSDTYEALDMNSRLPDYETLMMVKRAARPSNPELHALADTTYENATRK